MKSTSPSRDDDEEEWFCAINKTDSYLVEEPCTKDNLGKIVKNKQSAELERRAILHEVWAPNFNDHHITETDE